MEWWKWRNGYGVITGGNFDVNRDGHIGIDDLIAKVTGGAKNLQHNK
jgi:hypothetical protein